MSSPPSQQLAQALKPESPMIVSGSRWTPEQDAALVEGWKRSDLSITALAQQLGRSRDGISQRAWSLQLPPKPRFTPPNPDSFWTAERVVTLRELFAEGQSARQIATHLGLPTRNPVISKLWRLGLKRSPEGVSASRRTGAQVRRPRAPKPPLPRKPHLGVAGNAQVFVKANAAPRAKSRKDAFAPLPMALPIPWTERPWNGCAWPAGGDGADMLCCALPRHGTGPYCPEHGAMAYAPSHSTANAYARGLRRYADR